jgi:hypothetical protein
MSELSRDARSVIAQARANDGPSAEDRARIRARLDPTWAAYRAREAGGAGTAVVGAKRPFPRAVSVLWASLVLWAPGSLPRVETAIDSQPEQPSAASSAVQAATPRMPGEPAAAPTPSVSRAAPPERTARVASASSGSARRAELANPHRRSARDAATRERTGRHATLAASPLPSALDAQLSAATPAASLVAAADSDDAEHARAPALGRASRTRAPDSTLRSSDAPVTDDSTPVRRAPGFVAQPIDDELEWIGAAEDALRKGQPSAVLRLVQEHAFRFPQGALAPERMALHALALCALQRRAAARVVLADLAQHSASSPLLDRVHRNCGL